MSILWAWKLKTGRSNVCFYCLHRQSNITAKVWCANISGNETTPPQTERQSSFFLFTLPLAENLALLSWPIRRKVTCSGVPALYVCYKHFLRFLIGSIDWHRQLWLARLNTFILILEKHSDKTRLTGFHTIQNNNLGSESQDAPFFHPWFGEEVVLNFSSVMSNIDLGQNKMEQQTPIPPEIEDKAKRKPKLILDLGRWRL